MNLSLPTVSTFGGVAADAGAVPFAGRGQFTFVLSAVSIIRIIQGR